MNFPKINDNFYFDGVNWTVVGVGNRIFEYEANKGIFAVVNLEEMDCLLIIIRNKEVKIEVNPSLPSVKANNVELLTEYGNIGTYVLLEFNITKN